MESATQITTLSVEAELLTRFEHDFILIFHRPVRRGATDDAVQPVAASKISLEPQAIIQRCVVVG